jgi:hypothetical protein
VPPRVEAQPRPGKSKWARPERRSLSAHRGGRAASAANVVLLCLLVCEAVSIGASQTRSSGEVPAIDAYARQIDSFIKRNPKRGRIFANVSDDDTDRWREFKSKRQFEKATEGIIDESAIVWFKSGSVVGANFTFQSSSGDWAQYVTYYFRADGSLAKIHAQLNTFHGNISVVRDKSYSRNGKVLRETTRYLDLKTQKPIKPTDFMDEEIPVYQTVHRLPFFKLL